MFPDSFQSTTVALPPNITTSVAKSNIPNPPHPIYTTQELLALAGISKKKLPSLPYNSDESSNIERAIRALEIPFAKKQKRCISPSQLNLPCNKRPHNFASALQPPERDQPTNWKKENHNAIEKKRRDYINAYIEEIHGILLEKKVISPSSDKLSTLSAAIEYLKSVKPNTAVGAGQSHLPSMVREEFSNLVTSVMRGFLITFKCADYKVIYVSNGVGSLLGISPSLLIGQDITKFFHILEVDKFKSNQKECILAFNDPAPSQDMVRKLSYSTYVHTMRGFLPGPNPQMSYFPVLFTGGFKQMTISENDTEVEGVLCFTAVLKILT